MKTAEDPRHKKRKSSIQKLFSYSFDKKQIPSSISPVIEKLEIIDEKIQKAAPEWPLEKINRVDLAILRLATYEICFNKDIPSKVSIDEAVEIAKSYGAESSPSFVNGVLGTILKTEKVEQDENN